MSDSETTRPDESGLAISDAVLTVVDVERNGIVERFDEAAGLGVITDGHGGEVAFHCTQITDGTRTIANGAAVVYELRRSNLGAVEATAIRLSAGAN